MATEGVMVMEGNTETEGYLTTEDAMVTVGMTVLTVIDKVREGLKIDVGHRLTYHGFIPVLVIVGVCINATCIVVLRRPAFLPFQVNRWGGIGHRSNFSAFVWLATYHLAIVAKQYYNKPLRKSTLTFF